MTEEREDELKLAMFPLMLQAIYNAQFYINKKTDGKDWRFVENSGHDEVGEAFRQMEDLRMILRALASAGIEARCPMEEVTNGFSPEKLFKMRHFSELERDHVMQLFDPDKSDYEETKRTFMETMQKVADEQLAEKDAKIKEMEDLVHKWKSIVGGKTGDIKRDFAVKHNEGLFKILNAVGRPELGKLITDHPMCSTVDEFRLEASQIKNILRDALPTARRLKRRLEEKLSGNEFDEFPKTEQDECEEVF